MNSRKTYGALKRTPLAVLVASLFATPAVYGAGFQISESSLSGMGRAFAGAGVAGDDASDMFYNPAGLMLNDSREIQLGASILDINGEFTNQGSTQRLLTAGGPLVVPARGGPDSDGGGTAAVPNFYYAGERRGNMRYGLNINAPFGLTTDYADNWVGRYHALKSELKTIDINPSVAWELSDSFSVGVGLSIQKAEATLSRAIFQGPGVPDGKSVVTGDNVGVGFNLGAMFSPSSATRIGIGYRSKINQKLEGDLTVSGTPRDIKLPATAETDLPETIYLSAAHDISDQWSVYGSVRWTKWSRFDELRINFNGVLPDDVTPEDWDDSTTFSLGAAYRMNDDWTLRFGYSKDQTPVPGTERRTPRIPDADRDWLTLGASYRPKSNMTIDFSFARISTDDAPLQNTTNLVSSAPGAFTDTLRGSFADSTVNIIGLQVRWDL